MVFLAKKYHFYEECLSKEDGKKGRAVLLLTMYCVCIFLQLNAYFSLCLSSVYETRLIPNFIFCKLASQSKHNEKNKKIQQGPKLLVSVKLKLLEAEILKFSIRIKFPRIENSISVLQFPHLYKKVDKLKDLKQSKFVTQQVLKLICSISCGYYLVLGSASKLEKSDHSEFSPQNSH